MAAPEILREVAAAHREPVYLMVRGQSGSGKSLLLASIRDRLRDQGVALRTELNLDLPDHTAVVIDDAHTLSQADLTSVQQLIDQSRVSVIVATQARPHSAELRAVADSVAQRGRVFDLRAMSVGDIAKLGRDLGVPLTPALATVIRDLTAGARSGVYAAVHSLRSAEQRDADTVRNAVTEWAWSVIKAQDSQLVETLTLTATGAGLDPAEVAEIVGVDDNTATELIDRARSCGLVADPDLLLEVAEEPLRRVVGDRTFARVQQRISTLRLDAGVLRAHTAVRLARAGLIDSRLAEFLCSSAETAEPSAAAEMYSAAIRAGADPDAVALRYAEVSALSGDLDTAVSLATGVLERAGTSDSELTMAVRILSRIWSHRGVLDRSAQLYKWLGPDRVGAEAGTAAAILIAAGEPQAALDMLARGPSGPPTDITAGIAQFGAAMHQSVTGPGPSAVNSFARVVSTLSSPSAARQLPISPAAAAAMLAIHNGDLPRASALLARALETDRPGSSTWQQHRLLSAWGSMLRGDEDAARSTVEQIRLDRLGNRDLLLAQALLVGLARRAGDHGALTKAWADSHRVIDEVSVDLFTVLPLGELWLAAIRVGDAPRIAHLVDEASALLGRLGDPPAWSSTFHWYGVQAAILSENPAALIPHAHALKEASDDNAYAAALATAGRAWLRVLREEAGAVEVEQSARTLGSIGLPWDGARLASEAALRAADTETATALLQVARALRQTPRRIERAAASPTTGAFAGPTAQASGPLSDREGEVADLLVLGLTYREVGARLYISAKTVEHHVARIRRRLGAGSRSELLSMLRAMGHGKVDGSQLV